jgi:hypothetical protein
MTNPSQYNPLRCSCGSTEICLCFTAPVLVYVEDGAIREVQVADEETRFEGVLECLCCDRSWVLHEEPQLGDWPAWSFGP